VLKHFLFIFVITICHVKAQSPANGNELIHAMHAKYQKNKWYQYFTFSQNMEYYRNDSIIKKEIWHEAAALPGKLLIKFNEKSAGNGVLFTNHKIYSFKNSAVTYTASMVHDLLLVGLDVYFLKPERTVSILDSLGYHLNLIREDTWDGKKVFVVGAPAGDDHSRQFWVDAENLFLYRIVYPQNNSTFDVTFADYEKIKGNWVSKTIIFKRDGKLNLIEKYYDIQFPKKIKEADFLPENFGKVVLQ